jgi:glyoxylase I family protein
MNPDHFRPHHVAISVRDIQESTKFYALLGFRERLVWQAADDSLVIIHMSNAADYFLEVFCYRNNRNADALSMGIGNDLEAIGVKHFAFKVNDINATYVMMRSFGHFDLTPVKKGRTLIEFFFARDPDGMWVEVVQDDRKLPLNESIELREGPI